MLHAKKRKIKKIVKISVLAIVIALVVGVAVKLCVDLYKDASQPLKAYGDETIMLGDGLSIAKYGRYSGEYMEDGSDEILEDVMFVLLQNNSSNDLQFAEITLEAEDITFKFSASNIPSGASVMLLDSNAAKAEKEIISAEAHNIVFFQNPMNTQSELINIQELNGIINITNISGDDISNDIHLYYKNGGDNLFFGGITYVTKLTGGIKADETKQISAKHFIPQNSEIVNVILGVSE